MGMVYRNEYCAYCNGVEELITWQIDLACNNNVPMAILQSNLSTLVDNDPMIFQRECQEWSYRLPSLPPGISPPRSCIASINFCLPKPKLDHILGNISSVEYAEMERNCSFGILDPVEAMNGRRYKNSNCAKCNAVTVNKTDEHISTSKQLQTSVFPSPTESNISIISVATMNSSTISLYTGQDSLLLSVSCPEGNLPVLFGCHSMPCSFFYPHGKKYCPDFKEVLNQCFSIPTNCSSMKYTFNSTQTPVQIIHRDLVYPVQTLQAAQMALNCSTNQKIQTSTMETF